jgi:ATP-dependent DNA ligase
MFRNSLILSTTLCHCRSSRPFAPMEALSGRSRFQEGDGWQYEPKWDGFRCLIFRDGDDVQLQSKSGQPLARYFPEIVEAIRALKPKRFVLDGETGHRHRERPFV